MKSLDFFSFTENESRSYIQSVLWPDGQPVCPHCGRSDCKPLDNPYRRHPSWWCQHCRKRFNLLTNTIFQGTHLPLNIWLYAIARMFESKQSLRAAEFARHTGIGKRTSWLLLHKIREAMREPLSENKLTGIVEVDEVFVGGKPPKIFGKKNKRGRGTDKANVLVMTARTGRAKVAVIPNQTRSAILKVLLPAVDSKATIYTDEFTGYNGVGKHFEGGRQFVKHKEKEYVREGVSTNLAESFNNTVKRMWRGYFKISKKHLPAYCDETACRWNHRNLPLKEHVAAVVLSSRSKSLTYRNLVERAKMVEEERREVIAKPTENYFFMEKGVTWERILRIDLRTKAGRERLAQLNERTVNKVA